MLANFNDMTDMTNFNECLDLREHATKIINYEKKEMIPLIKEEEMKLIPLIKEEKKLIVLQEDAIYAKKSLVLMIKIKNI